MKQIYDDSTKMRLVSVIIPTYNRAKNIINALNSVKEQTYRPIEILVIDDGSDDNTKKVIQAWKEENDNGLLLTRYIFQENAGAPVARNNGIKNAKGRYIQFFDSDDYLTPEKLDLQISLMKKEKTSFCICDYEHIDPEGNFLRKMTNNKNVNELIETFIGQHTSIGVYEKDFLKRNNLKWNPKIKKRQDTDFNTKAMMVVKEFSYVGKVLFQWVRHEETGITNNIKMDNHIYSKLFRSALWFHICNFYRIPIKRYNSIFLYYKFLIKKQKSKINMFKGKIKNILLIIASYLIPKKKNYLVFYPIHDKENFSGNIRSLILYINNNYPSIKTGLITESENTRKIAQKEGVYTIHSNFKRVFWHLLRAQYILVDAYSKKFVNGRFVIIQLWHGSGFKNVGTLYHTSVSQEKRKATYKKIYRKCKFIAATSESDAQKQNLSFQTNRSVVTGYPRNDVFFENKKMIQTLKSKYHLQKYDRIITYAPTYRFAKINSRSKNISQPLSRTFWEQIQNFLAQSDSVMIIKKHPYDLHFKLPQGYSNILDLTKDSITEDILQITDLLISDYSSIITDFAITGRPILIYAYDLEQYTENIRSLYYDLEEILPKPFIRNEEELLEKIKNNEWQNDPKVKESYNHFRNMFHKYLDGNSSQRVVEEILKQNNFTKR